MLCLNKNDKVCFRMWVYLFGRQHQHLHDDHITLCPRYQSCIHLCHSQFHHKTCCIELDFVTLLPQTQLLLKTFPLLGIPAVCRPHLPPLSASRRHKSSPTDPHGKSPPGRCYYLVRLPSEGYFQLPQVPLQNKQKTLLMILEIFR